MEKQKYVTTEGVRRVWYKFLSRMYIAGSIILFIWFITSLLTQEQYGFINPFPLIGAILLIIFAIWANSEANKKKPFSKYGIFKELGSE